MVNHFQPTEPGKRPYIVILVDDKNFIEAILDQLGVRVDWDSRGHVSASAASSVSAYNDFRGFDDSSPVLTGWLAPDVDLGRINEAVDLAEYLRSDWFTGALDEVNRNGETFLPLQVFTNEIQEVHARWPNQRPFATSLTVEDYLVHRFARCDGVRFEVQQNTHSGDRVRIHKVLDQGAGDGS
jgi:hypothetical protein